MLVFLYLNFNNMKKQTISKSLTSICIFLSSVTLLSACQQNSTKSTTSPLLTAQKHIFYMENFAEDFPGKTTDDNLIPLLPKNQWNALSRKDLGSMLVININPDLSRIRMALNCKSADEAPFYLIEDSDGVDVLSSAADNPYKVDFILDNKVFKQPFSNPSSTNFEQFKQAFYRAQIIQIKAYIPEKYFINQEQQQHNPAYDFKFHNRFAETQKEPSVVCSPKK